MHESAEENIGMFDDLIDITRKCSLRETKISW
jgi:hypothetical protein